MKAIISPLVTPNLSNSAPPNKFPPKENNANTEPTLPTNFGSIAKCTFKYAGYWTANAADTVTRLGGYFNTAEHVVGIFGLVVLSTFTVLSALTTILGSFYYTTKLFKNNSVNKNIAIYLVLIISAGTLAVFGANVVFEAVDLLLLFVLSGINVSALAIFTFKHWEVYKLSNKKEKIVA